MFCTADFPAPEVPLYETMLQMFHQLNYLLPKEVKQVRYMLDNNPGLQQSRLRIFHFHSIRSIRKQIFPIILPPHGRVYNTFYIHLCLLIRKSPPISITLIPDLLARDMVSKACPDGSATKTKSSSFIESAENFSISEKSFSLAKYEFRQFVNLR